MNWIKAKLSELWHYIYSTVSSDALDFIDTFTAVFVIAAIIGIYFIMAGERKLGSKISSISFLSYVMLRVVLSVYAK